MRVACRSGSNPDRAVPVIRKQIIASGLEHRWLFPFVPGKNE